MINTVQVLVIVPYITYWLHSGCVQYLMVKCHMWSCLLYDWKICFLVEYGSYLCFELLLHDYLQNQWTRKVTFSYLKYFSPVTCNLVGNSKGPKMHRHGAPIWSQLSTISIEHRKTNNNISMAQLQLTVNSTKTLFLHFFMFYVITAQIDIIQSKWMLFKQNFQHLWLSFTFKVLFLIK